MAEQSDLEKSTCIDYIPNSSKYFTHDFESKNFGIDNSTGQYADVSILKCKKCHRMWLRCYIEMEWHSYSGRWFEGEISEFQLSKITPETAIDTLENLPLITYGGGFFDGVVQQDDGSVITRHFRQ